MGQQRKARDRTHLFPRCAASGRSRYDHWTAQVDPDRTLITAAAGGRVSSKADIRVKRPTNDRAETW